MTFLARHKKVQQSNLPFALVAILNLVNILRGSLDIRPTVKTLTLPRPMAQFLKFHVVIKRYDKKKDILNAANARFSVRRNKRSASSSASICSLR